MSNWASKDPDAVLDYSYTIPLDSGDSVDTYLLEVIEGTAVIDSGEDDALAALPTTDADGNLGQLVSPVWLSGGTAGEINLFKISWITTGEREDERFITLPISENDALALTGYAKPSAQHLVDRYPAFAAVAFATIEMWLTDAERSVDESWTEGDYAVALMLLAAHNMTQIGLGTGAEAQAAAAGASGYKVMRSGSLTLERFDSASSGGSSSGFTATSYGQQFAELLRRNRGGPRVAPAGAWPVPASYGWTRGQG